MDIEDIKKQPVTPEAHRKGAESYGRWVQANGQTETGMKLLAELGALVDLMSSCATVGDLASFVQSEVNRLVNAAGSKSPVTNAFTTVGMGYLRACCQKMNVANPLEINPPRSPGQQQPRSRA